MTQTTTQTMTNEEALERFKTLFHNLNTVNEDIKALADDAKEAGLDVAPIKAAAKLLADQSEGKWQDKVDAIKKYLG